MSDPFNTSIPVLSTHVESKEWISNSQLTLSSSLKNFCKDTFNGYFLAGMTMGRAAGILMKCESFSLFSRFFGNSFGTRVLAGGLGMGLEGTVIHVVPQVLETGHWVQEGMFLGSLNSSLTILACQIAMRGAPPNRVIREVTMNCSIMGMEAMTQVVGISDQPIHHTSAFDWYLSTQLASFRVQMGSHFVQGGLPHISRRETRRLLGHEIDRAGEQVSRRARERSWGFGVGGLGLRVRKFEVRELVADNGMIIHEREINDATSQRIFARNGDENSLFQKISSKLPPETKRKAIQQGKRIVGAAIAFAFDLARRFDAARFTPPDPTLLEIRIKPIPSPLQSTAEGALIAEQLGLTGRSTYEQTCRELQSTPETLKAYEAFHSQREKFQQELQGQFDIVLEQLVPLLDRLDAHVENSLSPAIERYEKKAKEVLGSEGSVTLADVLLNLRFASDHSVDQYSNETLFEMGYESRSIERTKRLCYVFQPGVIETVLDSNQKFEGAVGVERLRKAAQAFDKTYPQRLRSEKLAEEILELEKQNPEDQTKIGQLKTEGKKIENEISEQTSELKAAFTEFLSDPSIAKFWLVENALHSSVRKLLFRNEVEILEQILPHFIPEQLTEIEGIDFRIRTKKFLEASAQLKKIHQEMERGKRGIIDYLASIVGSRDYHDLQIAAGALEGAKVELLTHHINRLIQPAIESIYARHSSIDLNPLIYARAQLFQAIETWIQIPESGIRSFSGPMRELVKYHDQEMGELRELGIRIGFQRYKELLTTRMQFVVGREIFEEKIAPRLRSLEENLEKQLKEYSGRHSGQQKALETILRGRGDPRNFNRRIEASVRTVIDQIHDFVVQTANEYRVDLGPLSHFMPMFEAYTSSKDLASWKNAIPYLIPLIPALLRFMSGKDHGYPTSYLRYESLRYMVKVANEIAPQTFYIDPAIRSVANYFEGFVVSGHHDTHLNFMPGTSLSVLALRKKLGMPSTMSKFDLTLPIVTEVLRLLSILVPNTYSGLQTADSIASEVVATGSLLCRQFEPSAVVRFPYLTMGLAKGEGFYGYRDSSPTGEVLPKTRADFDLAEAASVTTGRPSMMVLAQTPGAFRNYPNQHYPLALHRYRSSCVLKAFPLIEIPNSSKTNLHTPENDLFRILHKIYGEDPRFDSEYASFVAQQKRKQQIWNHWKQIPSALWASTKTYLSNSDPFMNG